MTYKLLLSETAYRDLEQLRAYLALAHSEGYLEKVLNRMELLTTFPRLGQETKNAVLDYARCRYLFAQNHVVIYQINEPARAVYVLRVLSHYQNWKDVLAKDLLLQRGKLVSEGPWSIYPLDEGMIDDYYRNPPLWIDAPAKLDKDWTLQDAAEDVIKAQASHETENGPFVYAVFYERFPKGYLKLSKADHDWNFDFSFSSASMRELPVVIGFFLKYLSGRSSIRVIRAICRVDDKVRQSVLRQCGFDMNEADSSVPQKKVFKTATYVMN